jgi:predicted MPP superfamily phosphohydrolase
MTRRDMLRMLGAIAVGTGVGTAVHGYEYERHSIGLTRTFLPTDGLPEALEGVRIGFISDLHRSGTVSHVLIEQAVRMLMNERPDLIVLGGDYVTHADVRYMESAAAALGGLSAPVGVFGVVGNHDDETHMPKALARHGVEMLIDARTTLRVRGERLDLIGVRYETKEGIVELANGSAITTILLAHTPWRLNIAAELGIPLMLSGHTHGGQIVFPGLGPLAARNFPVIAGVARLNTTTAFVTRGIGTVYVPIRVNCPPEVAVLTLRSTRLGGVY